MATTQPYIPPASPYPPGTGGGAGTTGGTVTTQPVGSPTPIPAPTTVGPTPYPPGVTGGTTGGGTVAPPTTTTPTTANALTSDQSSAVAILNSFLTQVGLGSLGTWAWNKALTGDSVDQIMLELRATPEYKARFPAMDTLAQRGEAISEASYIQYETSIKNLVQRYGIPKGMYDTPDAIARMLTNSVSVNEAQDRANAAAVAAFSVPASVRDAFAAKTGVANTNGGLIAAYLDDSRAFPLLEQQFAQAQVAGAAADAQLSQAVSEADVNSLAARGLSYQQALTGFQQVAGTAGLGGGFGETIGQQQRIAAQFGEAQAQATQQRVQRGRLAQFSGAGNLAESSTGVAGLASSSSQ